MDRRSGWGSRSRKAREIRRVIMPPRLAGRGDGRNGNVRERPGPVARLGIGNRQDLAKRWTTESGPHNGTRAGTFPMRTICSRCVVPWVPEVIRANPCLTPQRERTRALRDAGAPSGDRSSPEPRRHQFLNSFRIAIRPWRVASWDAGPSSGFQSIGLMTFGMPQSAKSFSLRV